MTDTIFKKAKKHYSEIGTMKGAVDYLFCRYRYGVTIEEYQRFGFRKLNHYGRNSFLAGFRREAIIDFFNPKSARIIADDKVAFNKRFAPFLFRAFMDPADVTFEEFCAFFSEHRKLVVKPKFGKCGKGIKFISYEDSPNLREVYNEVRSQQCVLDEAIVQHEKMASLHPESLNTVRIVTIRGNGKINIIGAALRIGSGGSTVDNFHSGGIAASVDVDTGLVKTTAVNTHNQRFIRHPDTGVAIIGFEIPNWSRVMKTAVEAASALPEMDLIGWDVAFDAKGNVLLVEANSRPGFDILQTPCREGCYYTIKPFVDSKRKSSSDSSATRG